MESSFEYFDHTADMGVRVRAASLMALLEPATRAFYGTIGELVGEGAAREVRFRYEGDDPAYMLHDYLSDLLALFESQSRIITAVDVGAFDGGSLDATGADQAVDEEQSAFHREVKAITYHGLDIHPIEGGVEAVFIVDI